MARDSNELERRLLTIERAVTKLKSELTFVQHNSDKKVDDLEQIVRRQLSLAETSYSGQQSLQRQNEQLRKEVSRLQNQIQITEQKRERCEEETKIDIRICNAAIHELNSKLAEEFATAYASQIKSKNLIEDRFDKQLDQFRSVLSTKIVGMEREIIDGRRQVDNISEKTQSGMSELMTDYQEFRLKMKGLFQHYREIIEDKLSSSLHTQQHKIENLQVVLKAEITARTSSQQTLEQTVNESTSIVKRELKNRKQEQVEFWDHIMHEFHNVTEKRPGSVDSVDAVPMTQFQSFEEQHVRDLRYLVEQIREIKSKVRVQSNNKSSNQSTYSTENERPETACTDKSMQGISRLVNSEGAVTATSTERTTSENHPEDISEENGQEIPSENEFIQLKPQEVQYDQTSRNLNNPHPRPPLLVETPSELIDENASRKNKARNLSVPSKSKITNDNNSKNSPRSKSVLGGVVFYDEERLSSKVNADVEDSNMDVEECVSIIESSEKIDTYHSDDIEESPSKAATDDLSDYSDDEISQNNDEPNEESVKSISVEQEKVSKENKRESISKKKEIRLSASEINENTQGAELVEEITKAQQSEISKPDEDDSYDSNHLDSLELSDPDKTLEN